MGYTTTFHGELHFNQSVTDEIVRYINAFSRTRHTRRNIKTIKELFPNWQSQCWKGNLGTDGEYFIGLEIQVDRPYIDNENTFNSWIRERNRQNAAADDNVPPQDVPGLWCHWIINERGNLCWSGDEKFYDYEEWLVYLINRFFEPEGYVLNGRILYSGERDDDMGYLFVKDNKVVKVYAWDYAGFSEAAFWGEMERLKDKKAEFAPQQEDERG